MIPEGVVWPPVCPACGEVIEGVGSFEESFDELPTHASEVAPTVHAECGEAWTRRCFEEATGGQAEVRMYPSGNIGPLSPNS
jgi:hypothetical protein